jgi:thymidylate synthase (FAD)
MKNAKKLIGVEHKVLDKGFVRLVDYMGNDARIVQSARVSYGMGTKTVREDAALIDYLIRNDHGSPLEMVEFVFHLKMPLFVIAQLARHRISSTNQASARYSEMKDEFLLPNLGEIRLQGKKNKQAGDSLADHDTQADSIEFMEKANEECYEYYRQMLDSGVCREQARMILPQSLYSELYWKINLRSLFNFLHLRLHPHAQKEIRVYAETMVPIVAAIVPMAWASFKEHVLYGVKLSRKEVELIRSLINEKCGTIYDSGNKGLLEKLGVDKCQ